MRSRALIVKGAILAGVGAACAALLPSRVLMEEQFHESYPLAAGGRISLDNINGDVSVAAWDHDEVRVDAVKRASSREGIADVRIVVDATRNFVRIQTRYPESNVGDDMASVQYALRVPRHARVDEIKLINGELEISGVSGAVRVSTVNGSVRARNLAGDARISTVNGRVEADFDRLDPDKTIYLNSVNGSIQLCVPHDAHADFTASNVTGNIHNDFGLPVERGGFIGSKLRASWKGGGTRIQLVNVNGNIRIIPVAKGRRVRFT